VFCLSFSPGGQLLAAGSGDNRISLWRCAADGSAQFTHDLPGHTSWVLSLAFHPSGLQLCSGSKDASIRCAPRASFVRARDFMFPRRLWALDDGGAFGRCTATLTNHTQPVYSVAYCPSGSVLASGSKDKSIKLWDLARADGVPVCTSTLLHHAATVWAVAFSPNGLQLASCAGDGSIQLWSLRAGGGAVASSALAGHAGNVSAIAYNPRGRQLVSSSEDTSMRVWM